MESNFIILTIRPGIQPMERERIYGDPLHLFLTEKGVGHVSGGGTSFTPATEDKEIDLEYSDVEIQMNSREKSELLILLQGLKQVGYPEQTRIVLWGLKELTFLSISSFETYLIS